MASKKDSSSGLSGLLGGLFKSKQEKSTKTPEPKPASTPKPAPQSAGWKPMPNPGFKEHEFKNRGHELYTLADGVDADKDPRYLDFREGKMAVGVYRKECMDKICEIGEEAIPYLLLNISRPNNLNTKKLLEEFQIDIFDFETLNKYMDGIGTASIMSHITKNHEKFDREKLIPVFREQLAREHLVYRVTALKGLVTVGETNVVPEILKVIAEIEAQGETDSAGKLKLSYGDTNDLSSMVGLLKTLKAKEAIPTLTTLVQKVEPKLERTIRAAMGEIQQG